MRLDVYLCDNGLVASRTEAKKFILSGAVSVGGQVVSKPAFEVDGSLEVTVDKSSKKYVSRGGLKLEAAIESFKISANNKLAIDIGASSGGFTDCLLKYGAKHVIAVDSGTMQLVSSLRADERVTSKENFNARYMTREDFEYIPELAVMDVSFISATYIIKPIYDCLADNADFVCLIKPQFEVGKANIGKGGIVKSESARLGALDKVISFAKSVGFEHINHIVSPIIGGDGNIEYLAHFKKTNINGEL